MTTAVPEVFPCKRLLSLRSEVEDFFVDLDDDLEEEEVAWSGWPWFIAGGAIVSALQGELHNDIDVYLEAAPTDGMVVRLARRATETAYAFTHGCSGGPIQVIKMVMGKPEKVISTFDWSHSRVWLDRCGQVWGTHETHEAIKRRRLIYHGSPHPVKAFQRMLKFIRRGWWIDRENYDKLVESLRAVDVSGKFDDEAPVPKVWGALPPAFGHLAAQAASYGMS